MKISININETVSFQLTDHGKNIWKQSPFVGDEYPKSLMLWEFMHIFGRYIYIGGDSVIEGNELVFAKGLL